ncbi:hypothetical protein [Dehalogenimonas etheniformans]|uniref:Uncharacterized protein n=1 Tax=Dehalogenimonas etheniformans TaxID=1536648 RepID=A0A2P5P7W2_9CHLR|nr:hypothetical protein [Dehalogenimonas etheniformans]PPD58398.1 hypothetical protein JP09_004645 [Dehalogenimonas etheniformans]QNT76972.1 hypothetical protein HX448_09945 [Dehalogenimonas etheniformans]
MDRKILISELKNELIHDISSLCSRRDVLWIAPIVETIRDLQISSTRAVFFGGTLRSLLLSRLKTGKFGRPRDIDIVVSGASLDQLREQFQEYFTRETRFGGLSMKRSHWQFDIWPLEQTMAFRECQIMSARFESLPSTTFFNLEAVAVDAWTTRGQARKIYSDNDQFFDGIVDRILEINNENNQFPALCVVRALVLASDTHFAIGPKLASYLTNVGGSLSDAELQKVQLKHYNRIRYDVGVMRVWLQHISKSLREKREDPILLPSLPQLTLWEENELPKLAFHLFVE